MKRKYYLGVIRPAKELKNYCMEITHQKRMLGANIIMTNKGSNYINVEMDGIRINEKTLTFH